MIMSGTSPLSPPFVFIIPGTPARPARPHSPTPAHHAQGGEAPARLGLVEVDQAGEGAPGPRLWGSEEIVVRERRDGHGDRDLVGLLRGRADEVLVAVLPVEPRGRGRGVRQPVDRKSVV